MEDRSSLARVVPVQREEHEQQQKTTLENEIVALKWQKNIRKTLMKNNRPPKQMACTPKEWKRFKTPIKTIVIWR